MMYEKRLYSTLFQPGYKHEGRFFVPNKQQQQIGKAANIQLETREITQQLVRK